MMKERSSTSSHGTPTPSSNGSCCNTVICNEENVNDKKNGAYALSENETKNVNRIRAVVAIVVAVATLSMSMTIYYYVRNSESKNFHRAFDSDAKRLLNGVGESIKSNLAVLDAFASTLVSMAKQSNQTFPYVSLPTFGIKASKLLSMTDAFIVSIQPVVYPDQRLRWENYSVENQWWVNETKAIQEIDEFYYDNVTYGQIEPSTIFGLNGTVPYDSK
jgi:hypothetical protein